LYSSRSFLSISLALENPLSITLSLYPRLFKWWRKSPTLCLVVFGAYSFYTNGLAEWDTLKTVLRMATTGWKVLMFVCGNRV
jgi:hypothetical protein